MRLFETHPHLVPDTRCPPPTELRVHGLPRRESRWQGSPCTVALHHIDNRLQHTPAIMGKGAAGSVWRREQGCPPAPPRVDRGWQRRRFAWLVRRWRVPLPVARVVVACPGLVPPAPPRPRQDAHRAPLYTSHEWPEQPSAFGPAQADRSPRCALTRDKPVFVRPCTPFLGGTAVPVSARTTAKNACAHRAKVRWRYHPVHLRTS